MLAFCNQQLQCHYTALLLRKDSPGHRPRLSNENYYFSPAKLIVVVLVSRQVVMMTPEWTGHKACDITQNDVSCPAPNNTAIYFEYS